MSERTKALFQKAFAAYSAGRLEAALTGCSGILRLDPFNFEALQLGGTVAVQLNRLEMAMGYFQRARRIRSRSTPTLICLGLVYTALCRNTEAEETLKASLELEPSNPEAWMAIGYFLNASGRDEEALRCFHHVSKLKPDHAGAVTSIATIQKAHGEMGRALEGYRSALTLDPANTDARIGLVETLSFFNRTGEALAESERLLKDQPGNIQAHSHRLFILNYQADISTERLFAEHRRFGRLLPAAPQRRFANPRDPEKRMRVAFLSPDLRLHPIAFFLEPLLAHIDPERFEVVLYHDHRRVDSFSERLRPHASIWRNFWGRPDHMVEDAIIADAPDVIVDLAGHSGQNRVHLFARRLAPVQVTYLGYPNTTGVEAMDYRFTDEVADPKGDADTMGTERLVRFSPCAWTFRPPLENDADLPIAAAGENEAVTFGSFNNLSKVNDATLRIWGEVLSAVPGSRLLLKSNGMDPDGIRPRLVAARLDPASVVLLGPMPDAASHMACYQNVDIALDPFPYGGTTTTCEALWMGRPVVTLAGDRHSSRVGASLLSAIGRTEWIARSPEEYVRIARGLAADRSLLRLESAGLREAVRRSVLLDHRGQARRFGDALRSCWRSWCEGRGDGRPPVPADHSDTLAQPELVHG